MSAAALTCEPLRHDLGPFAPAHVIAGLIAPIVERDGGPAPLARRCGVGDRRIYSIVNGRQRWVSFDVADRLLTRGLGDPALWWTVPELAAVYSDTGAQLPFLDDDAA